MLEEARSNEALNNPGQGYVHFQEQEQQHCQKTTKQPRDIAIFCYYDKLHALLA